MGDPRKLRKKYKPPKHPWEAERIGRENEIKKSFGLRNKQEIWRADSLIKKFRYSARSLVGIPIEQRKGEEEQLLSKLQKLGLLKEGSTLDDALSLKTEDLLARRLQTLVWRKGIANTLAQARQLITHGHIAVKKRKMSSPGATIGIAEEGAIDWYGEPLAIVKKVEPPVEEKKPEPVAEAPKAEEKPAEAPAKEKKARKPRKKKEEKKEEVKEAKTNA